MLLKDQSSNRLKRFLTTWFINTCAVLAAVYIVPGLQFKDQRPWIPLVAALVLGILNAMVRPLLMFFALPLLIVTLGLFTLVINALVLYLVGLILGSYFHVDSFGSAFLGAIIISLVSLVLNVITGNRSHKQPTSQRPPRRKPPANGKGPVIDV